MKVKTVKRVDGFKEGLYIPAFIQGFKLTLRHFFNNVFGYKEIVTIQYPEIKRPIALRWRGRHRLTRRDNGFVKCVACFMCETVCPANCIHIEAAEHDDKSIEKYPRVFDIDELRCVYCGLCVEACPKDAIRMDSGVIGLAFNNRKEFEFTRDMLMDHHTPNSMTKYPEVPLPTKEEGLKNSVSIPVTED